MAWPLSAYLYWAQGWWLLVNKRRWNLMHLIKYPIEEKIQQTKNWKWMALTLEDWPRNSQVSVWLSFCTVWRLVFSSPSIHLFFLFCLQIRWEGTVLPVLTASGILISGKMSGLWLTEFLSDIYSCYKHLSVYNHLVASASSAILTFNLEAICMLM